MEVGDGARYWILFLRLLGMFRLIKTPVVAGVEVGRLPSPKLQMPSQHFSIKPSIEFLTI